MAHHDINISRHTSLFEPGISDTVTFLRPFKAIEVVNRGDDNLFFKIGADSIQPYDDDTLIVPPQASLIVNSPTPSKPITLAIVSEEAQEYSVQGRL